MWKIKKIICKKLYSENLSEKKFITIEINSMNNLKLKQPNNWVKQAFLFQIEYRMIFERYATFINEYFNWFGYLLIWSI